MTLLGAVVNTVIQLLLIGGAFVGIAFALATNPASLQLKLLYSLMVLLPVVSIVAGWYAVIQKGKISKALVILILVPYVAGFFGSNIVLPIYRAASSQEARVSNFSVVSEGHSIKLSIAIDDAEAGPKNERYIIYFGDGAADILSTAPDGFAYNKSHAYRTGGSYDLRLVRTDWGEHQEDDVYGIMTDPFHKRNVQVVARTVVIE